MIDLFRMLGDALDPNVMATLQEMEDFTYTDYVEVKDDENINIKKEEEKKWE